MRFLLLLTLISLLPATEVLDTESFFATYSFAYTQDQALSSAIIALEPSKDVFKVDYGDGAFTTYLEELTLDLLEYDFIANIAYTLTDEFDGTRPDKRARILLSTNSTSLKFRLLF